MTAATISQRKALIQELTNRSPRVAPGEYLESAEVRGEEHVGLFDPDEAFDR